MSQPFACILKNRGTLSLAGADRRAFLQGIVSNDVNLCKPGKPVYAALLTPQGKFLHDLVIVDEGESLLLDCESDRADDLLHRLSAYKLRAKITLENVSTGYDVWAAWDGDAPQGWPQDPRLVTLGARDIVKKDSRPANVRPADLNDYDRHRLALGIPDGSRDMIIGKSTLIECNIDRLNGISWTKGCYMGQELTARMHHRALVKKRLFPVKILGMPPEAGAIVRERDADIGDMRSSNGDLGLALIDIEKADAALTAKRSFTCGGSQLFVLASTLPPA